MDELVQREPEEREAAFWSDTRPLREILCWRSGVQKPPEPTVSQQRQGKTLPLAEARQFSGDVLEMLDLAHSLLDDNGQRAAFDYELDVAAELHRVVELLRQNRGVYRERARIAQMLMDLHAIYVEVSKSWPPKLYDKASKRFRNAPPSPAITDPIMAKQRKALGDFCQAHDVDVDVDSAVALLERDGTEIHEVAGPANAAVEALQKIITAGAATIEKSLSISPFELARAQKRSFVDFIETGAWPKYDFAIGVLGALFERVTATPWPRLSTLTNVPGWPGMMGELARALDPSRGRAPGSRDSAASAAMSATVAMTEGFARFILRTVSRRPELLRELFREFAAETADKASPSHDGDPSAESR